LADAAADDLDVAGDEDLVVVDLSSPTLSPCGGNGGDVTLARGAGTGLRRSVGTFDGSVESGLYNPA